jgi:hypothetical protein
VSPAPVTAQEMMTFAFNIPPREAHADFAPRRRPAQGSAPSMHHVQLRSADLKKRSD